MRHAVLPAAAASLFSIALANFDAHCHDRYQLEARRLRASLPVHLMDRAARARFMGGVAHYLPPSNDIMRAPATPGEFEGAAGLHSFSAVYFNPARTLALTNFGMYCGGLCGNWNWVVLERTSTGWQMLPWVRVRTYS